MSWRSLTPGTGTRCWRRSMTAPRRAGCGRSRREKEPEGDGLPRGHIRIASPYDTDARWGVKREEFWLGYKLHVSETCDDPPPCSCRPGRPASQPVGGDEPGRSRAGGREHDKGCAQVAFPNLIT